MKKYLYILLAGLLLTGCISMKRGPEKAYSYVKDKDVTFDAIIVPGIPFENGSWDTVMKARVLWAWSLYKNGVTKNIIFSGDAVYSPYYESKIMGLYAQELGVPKEHIYYDTQARHSTENVYYSYLLARKLGFKLVALASDPLQSGLLRGYTRMRFGTPIYHMPFVMDTVRKYNHLKPSINPNPARKEGFVSITDVLTPSKRFKGTLGKDIEWDNYKGGMLPPL